MEAVQEVTRLKEEIEGWKKIAAGYQGYIDKLIGRLERVEKFVGAKTVVELELKAIDAGTF